MFRNTAALEIVPPRTIAGGQQEQVPDPAAVNITQNINPATQCQGRSGANTREQQRRWVIRSTNGYNTRR